jgi:4-hydroxymandelate oxidase
MNHDEETAPSGPPTDDEDPQRFLSLPEFEVSARRRLPHDVYEFLAGGAGDEHSVRANIESYQKIFLRPRVLRPVKAIEISQDLFERNLPTPIFLAPTAYQRLVHPDGELASAGAAFDHQVPFVLSSNGTTAIEDIMALPGARCWFQLYVQGERKHTRESIRRVEAAGCEAVCVTVDTPVMGVRPRQIHAGFRVPAHVKTPHAMRVRDESDPGAHSAVTWADVDWLRSEVKGKLLLKGILHPADAELAVRAGVDGIMVSNHGGRNLDTIIPTIEALPDIAHQVAGRVPVFVDGGIRHGTDVVKALARGATAVLIGRPYLYALAVGGRAGVARSLAILTDELRYAMALIGASALSELSRDIEWPRSIEQK